MKSWLLYRVTPVLLSGLTVHAGTYSEEFAGAGSSFQSYHWVALAFLDDGTPAVSDLSASTSAIGISGANGGYGFVAPKAAPSGNGDIQNEPLLLYTTQFSASNVVDMTTITFDWIADNTDAEARVAIEVGGGWYASTQTYQDIRSNPGQAANFLQITFSPTNFAAAANWQSLGNTVVGSSNPISLGGVASNNLSGMVSAVGLLIHAGVTPAADGDHVRIGYYAANDDNVEPPPPPSSNTNLLFIVVDDLNDVPGFMGTYPDAKTPNMDRLAAEGVVFTKAHCSYPLCGPSRASFMSGLNPTTLGVTGLIGYDALESLMPEVGGTLLNTHFKNNGYKVFAGGKIYHNGTPNSYVDITGGSKAFGRDEGINWPEAYSTSTDWGIPSYGDSDDNFSDKSNAEFAIARLNETHTEPFALMVGFVQPHVPWYTPQSYFDHYPNPEELSLMPFDTNDFDDISSEAENRSLGSQYPRTDTLTEDVVAANNIGKTRDQIRADIMQAYLSCVSFTDYYLGQVLDALDNSPYADNTYIIFFSDHGYHLGEKNTYQKNTLWERSSHVPLAISGPGIESGICTDPVSLLDLYPTIIELCGLTGNPVLEGQSLVPLLEDPTSQSDRPVLITLKGNNQAVQTSQYRYTSWSQGSEELYDHIADPDEIDNLADDPTFDTVKEKLRKYLTSNLLSPGFRTRFNPNSGSGASYLSDMLSNGTLQLYGQPISNLNTVVEGMHITADTSDGWVTLEVIPGTPFGTYRTGLFTDRELRNLALTGAGSNTDGDNWTLLLEYALNLDPLHPDIFSPLEFVPSGNLSVPRLNFNRDATRDDVDLFIESTTSLTNTGWTDIGHSLQGEATTGLNGFSVQESGTNPTAVQLTAPDTTQDVPARFFRFSAEENY